MKWRIRAAAAQTLSYNSFSARSVKEIKFFILHRPHNLFFKYRISQEGGQTRIAELFLTFHVEAAPIHLHGIPGTFFFFSSFLQQDLALMKEPTFSPLLSSIVISLNL